jgi:hypothetical protein
MKTTAFRWLVLLLIPGCILVQPLDEAKSDSGGVAGRGNSSGGASSKAGGANNSSGAPSRAGSGGTPSTAGTSGSHVAGSPGSGGAAGPTCAQGTLKNSAAAEKVIAASCFGIGVGGDFTCSYLASLDQTDCYGSSDSFYVSFSETSGGTVGDIYDALTDTYLGSVVQNAAGDYEFELADATKATCSVKGNIATLCADAGGA